MRPVALYLDHTTASAAIAGRPVVHPVHPLVSFTLFAGSSGTVVAARNRKLDAVG